MADTRKGLLQQQFDVLGGLTDAAMSPTAVYKAAVPVNARQFIKAATGDTSGVSEADLWPSDMPALKAAVAHAVASGKGRVGLEAADNTPNAGVFDYNDYPIHNAAFAVGHDGTRADKSLWNIIKQSYTDPSFRMATTVGSGIYGKNPDGTTSIKDTYDFDYPEGAYSLKQLAQQLMSGRVSTDSLLERLGNRVIGNASSGHQAQPYTLNVGTVK